MLYAIIIAPSRFRLALIANLLNGFPLRYRREKLPHLDKA